MEVPIPQLAWFGDSELKLKFPEEWKVSVQVMEGHGKNAVDKEEIIYALRNPVGTKPLRKLARGKKDVAIIFDDLTRPTKTHEVVPYIIDELGNAGIKDDNIRFVCANGSHGVFDREDFVKKLDENVIERYPVFNHNPYANLVYLGRTKSGTPVEINAEVMACDFKIALGCIVPHPYFGYGGGAKIVLPGVAGIHSICHNHGHVGELSTAQNHSGRVASAYGVENEENMLRLDSEEAAKMIGLDMIVNVLVDLRRNSTDLFTGDEVEAQRKGVEVAKEHYLTPVVSEADIVVSNAYSKASEAAIASWPVLTLKEGGDFVLVVNSPTGQVPHYVHGRWGIEVFGELYLAPPSILDRAERIILFSEYPERQPWLELVPPEKTVVAKTWDEVIEELENKHKHKARVAVYPDATIQKPF